MVGELKRSVLVQALLLESDLLYFSIDLFPVLKIVSKSAVYLGRGELREILEDVFSRQPATVVDCHGTDRKASPFENWPPTTHTSLPFDIRMSSYFLPCCHSKPFLAYCDEPPGAIVAVSPIYFSSLPLGAFSSQ